MADCLGSNSLSEIPRFQLDLVDVAISALYVAANPGDGAVTYLGARLDRVDHIREERTHGRGVGAGRQRRGLCGFGFRRVGRGGALTLRRTPVTRVPRSPQKPLPPAGAFVWRRRAQSAATLLLLVAIGTIGAPAVILAPRLGERLVDGIRRMRAYFAGMPAVPDWLAQFPLAKETVGRVWSALANPAALFKLLQGWRELPNPRRLVKHDNGLAPPQGGRLVANIRLRSTLNGHTDLLQVRNLQGIDRAVETAPEKRLGTTFWSIGWVGRDQASASCRTVGGRATPAARRARPAAGRGGARSRKRLPSCSTSVSVDKVEIETMLCYTPSNFASSSTLARSMAKPSPSAVGEEPAKALVADEALVALLQLLLQRRDDGGAVGGVFPHLIEIAADDVTPAGQLHRLGLVFDLAPGLDRSMGTNGAGSARTTSCTSLSLRSRTPRT